ncbi:MAG: hypothetical protein EPN91_02060 [Salinibacterium sp.]|nr:MAG: hypothetical protein EPN91_02060 [Salinibacterium sp.]
MAEHNHQNATAGLDAEFIRLGAEIRRVDERSEESFALVRRELDEINKMLDERLSKAFHGWANWETWRDREFARQVADIENLKSWRESHKLENATVVGNLSLRFDRLEDRFADTVKKMNERSAMESANRSILLGTDAHAGRDGLVTKVDTLAIEWANFSKSAKAIRWLAITLTAGLAVKIVQDGLPHIIKLLGGHP